MPRQHKNVPQSPSITLEVSRKATVEFSLEAIERSLKREALKLYNEELKTYLDDIDRFDMNVEIDIDHNDDDCISITGATVTFEVDLNHEEK